MTYKRVVPKVVVAHVALLALLVMIPLLRECRWFTKPPLEMIEIDLASLPPPPPQPDPPEPPDQEEEDVIPERTPIPTPRPTAEPTPAATATPAPTATPRPRPSPTPTPAWRARTAEEIRRDIENRAPEPVATTPSLSPEQIREMMGEGLPSSPGIPAGGIGGGGQGSSLAGVRRAVSDKFHSAWNQPRHLSSVSGLRATAEIVLRKDGTVQSARVQVRSGIQEFDSSVESALSSVTFVTPLPAEYDGSSHSFTLQFELTR